jgi:cyanophycinase
MNGKAMSPLGFGIDENTALIYIGSQNLVKVAGTAGVTIINANEAKISWMQKLPKIENLLVSYLDEGDTYSVSTGVITPAADKKPTRGNEYYKVNNPGQAGILSGYSNSFLDLITVNLMDNKSSDTIRNLSFYDRHAGFQVTLCKTPLSAGYYCDRPSEGDKYTVTGIRMDIIPVQISVTPMNNKQ